MKVPESSENEVVALRKLAQQLASSRRESLTTAHLLVAIATGSSPAADLLHERRLDVDTLARLARASTDNEQDPIGHAMRRSGEVARSSGAREPVAIHLLVALLGHRGSGAFRALEQSGIDLARMRAAAIALASGSVGPRRTVAHPPAAATASSAKDRRRPARPNAGMIVPLFPPNQSNPRTTAKPPANVGESSPPSTGMSEANVEAVPVAQPVPKSNPRKRTARPGQQPLRMSTQPDARFELDARSFPVLASLCLNLTAAAARGELDPVVGREAEIEQTLDVLAKRRSNNPCLIGPSGVGKTSIVRGLARRIASKAQLSSLDDRILCELPVSQMMSGSSRGAFAERVTALCKEVQQAGGRVVLAVDDLHQLFFGDAAAEASSEMKLALARGELPLVATATPEEFRRCVEADPALARCFTTIEVDEPSAAEAVAMIEGVAPGLERHHGLAIQKEAIETCVEWSLRYLPGRALPEKALSVLDLASARSRRRTLQSVTLEAVAELVSEMADVPVERLLETDRDRMLALEELLAERVVGHGHALRRIATILRRNAAGLRSTRPIGSFLLLGTTGVGKTETAKAVAEALFHAPDAMTRLDMSELAEPHSLARLIGSPPGYVGHEMGGQLTEAVRRRPYQVLLFDEFEKAHRDVMQSFLQILDEGRMTDGRGRTVDFTNTVIVLTSNLGGAEAREVTKNRSIGFSSGESSRVQAMEDAVVKAARGALPPELYNRIDEVLYFAPLTRDDVREVARRLLRGLSARLQQARDLELRFEDDGIEALLNSGGFDASLGARPMKRAIARLVEAPIAEMMLRQEVEPGDAVVLRPGLSGGLTLEKQPRGHAHRRRL